MKQKVYNFKKKEGHLGDIKFNVSDYFEYYHTGLETLIPDDMLVITQRHNNERSEVLAYEFLESADLSDTLLALNNDAYLWDSPYDNDMFEGVIDVMMEYIKKVHKTPLTSQMETKYQEVIREHVTIDDDMLRSVILPKLDQIQRISRMIKDELKNKIVS